MCTQLQSALRWLQLHARSADGTINEATAACPGTREVVSVRRCSAFVDCRIPHFQVSHLQDGLCVRLRFACASTTAQREPERLALISSAPTNPTAWLQTARCDPLVICEAMMCSCFRWCSKHEFARNSRPAFVIVSLALFLHQHFASCACCSAPI